jgi:precorrin-6Y C5,15-methyltransferase (decarboxylating)
MNPVAVVGTGLSFDDLTHKHLDIIAHADILVGGKRLLSWFPQHPAQKREIVSPVSEVISDIQKWKNQKKIVVLASGDPLFYGIGQTLLKAMGPQYVEIYSNISTLAAACARIKLSWDDIRTISLHGKNREQDLAASLRGNQHIFVLTDPKRNPQWLAAFVSQQSPHKWIMCVLEQLGGMSEKITWILPEKISGTTFSEPNVVVLKKEKKEHPRSLTLGAPEQWYNHDRGMITKSEVRAVSLARLRLLKDHLLWDLGAGSGSVSIEAALFITRGKIFAIDRHPDRIKQIQTNVINFGIRNVEVIQASLPDELENLPSPDRVFIGGGGKRIPAIIEKVSQRLLPGGRLVINTVLLETMISAIDTLNHLKFTTDIVQLQVNESTPMPVGMRFAAKNPVWIISGELQ